VTDYKALLTRSEVAKLFRVDLKTASRLADSRRLSPVG
jgi:hypothetical protein